ncbi:MAG: hypothetical protein RL287_593 [Actinomycetota bacterium]
MDNGSLKLLIVDDHAVVREGVKRAIHGSDRKYMITEAATFAEAQARIALLPPDVVVIDIHLPDNSGLELVLWLRDISQTMGIVVFSMNNHPEYVLAAFDNGASAFIDKSSPLSELLDTIDLAARLPLQFHCKDWSQALTYRREKTTLTARELEILQHLPSGRTYVEMAEALFISESTLKTHLQSIYRKLNARNRVEAINQARRLGILPTSDPNSTGP